MENCIDSGNIQRAEPEYLRRSVIRSVEAVRLCDEFVQVEAFPLLSSVALQKVCQMINNNVELLCLLLTIKSANARVMTVVEWCGLSDMDLLQPFCRILIAISSWSASRPWAKIG
jgi:hypothetical protein